MAMLLPGVQAARETALRSTCLLNSTRLAMAVQSYHAAHEHLPAGGDQSERPDP